jgi:hypothetical protein
MTTTYLLNEPHSNVTVTMQLDEDTGRFDCTTRPQLRRDQVPAFLRSYSRWCSQIAHAWSRRHGNNEHATVDFTHLLQGTLRIKHL